MIRDYRVPTDVICDVSAHYGIEPEDILTRGREAPIAWARHISMFLIRQHWGYSYPYIARMFGKRDHTTVIHAYKRVSQRASRDIDFAEWLSERLP